MKSVGHGTVDENQRVPIKVDFRNFYESRGAIARTIFFHRYECEIRKDRGIQINRGLRAAALEHEVGTYGGRRHILPTVFSERHNTTLASTIIAILLALAKVKADLPQQFPDFWIYDEAS